MQGRCVILAAGKKSVAPYLWMISGCFFTAWMGQFAHLLKDSCDWRVVALARGSVAFACAMLFARMSGAGLVFWGTPALWVRGVASSMSLLCMFSALAQLPTAEVLTLTNTFPIWVAFLSWPLLGVRPSLAVWVAAVFGVAGVALIQSPHFQAEPKSAFACLLALTAALTSAVAMLGLNRLKGMNPWAIVVHYSGVATCFVLAVCAWEPPDLSALADPQTLLLLLGVGVSATLGQVCVTCAFTSGQAARVSVVGLTQIVFALVLDLLLGGGPVAPVTLAGIAVVLAPTAWMMYSKAEPSRSRQTDGSRPGEGAEPAGAESDPAAGGDSGENRPFAARSRAG